jgi:hypothetical protein
VSLDTLRIHDVDILTAGTRIDVYGDPQPDWTTPTTITVKAWWAAMSSIEVLDGRDAVSTTSVINLPAGTPITALNRIRLFGRTFEINGEPMVAWTPRGEHHIECFLTTAVG